MPRFSDVPTIVFTDASGSSFSVKDIRPISNQVLSFEIDKGENDLLDEVSSRDVVFGDFGEIQSWRIFDLNITELTQVKFDLKKIKRLKVPV